MGLLQEAARVFGCVIVCVCARGCDVCVWVFMLFDSERCCMSLLSLHSSQKEAEKVCVQKCTFPGTVIVRYFHLFENGLGVTHGIANACIEIALMLIFANPGFLKHALV